MLVNSAKQRVGIDNILFVISYENVNKLFPFFDGLKFWVCFYIYQFNPDSHLPKKTVFICFNEILLKMMKHAFYFMLKALFVLEILNFLYLLSGYVGKRLNKKTKVNFKIYDVTDRTASNYHTHIVQYIKK